MGTRTVAILGFATSLGCSSERFSASSTTTLSDASISGDIDQRCRVTTALRSSSLIRAGSAAGATVSAYSRISATRGAVRSTRSIAGMNLPRSRATSSSSKPDSSAPGLRRTILPPVETL